MLDEMFDVYLHTGKAINNELDNYAKVTFAYCTYFYVDNIHQFQLTSVLRVKYVYYHIINSLATEIELLMHVWYKFYDW